MLPIMTSPSMPMSAMATTVDEDRNRVVNGIAERWCPDCKVWHPLNETTFTPTSRGTVYPGTFRPFQRVCRACSAKRPTKHGVGATREERLHLMWQRKRTFCRNKKSGARVICDAEMPPEIRDAQLDYCPVLGIRMEAPRGKGRGHNKGRIPSIDRVFPDGHYVTGNVAVMSGKANFAKNDADPVTSLRVAGWSMAEWAARGRGEDVIAGLVKAVNASIRLLPPNVAAKTQTALDKFIHAATPISPEEADAEYLKEHPGETL